MLACTQLNKKIGKNFIKILFRLIVNALCLRVRGSQLLFASMRDYYHLSSTH